MMVARSNDDDDGIVPIENDDGIVPIEDDPSQPGRRRAPAPPKTSTFGTICATVLLLSLGALLFRGCAGGGGESDSRETKEELSALASFDGETVAVLNANSFDWSGVSLVINNTWTGGFDHSVGRITSGAVVGVPIFAFTASDGARFNPLTHAVRDVTVMAHTPAGVEVKTFNLIR